MIKFIQKIILRIEKYSNFISLFILLVALIFITIWSIPTAREFLKSYILPGNPNSTDIYIVFLSIVISALVVIIKAFTKTNSDILDKLSKASYIIDSNFLKKGVLSVYEDASFEMNNNKRSNKHSMQIDILGFTLFSASYQFEKWLQEGKLKNLIVNLYFLAPDFTKGNDFFEDDWAQQTEMSLGIINKFKNRNLKILEDNNVLINLKPYRHLPSIHGFKISNGNYYVSFANWSETFQIRIPTNSTFVRVENNDRSDHAMELRKLYDNWLSAASNPIYTNQES
jgi:hypothetical protein